MKMANKTYEKIKDVLRRAPGPLAAHEFDAIRIPTGDLSHQYQTGREYVGQSEATIARRLREMNTLGIVSSGKRSGKQFVEYFLASEKPLKPCPQQPEGACSGV